MNREQFEQQWNTFANQSVADGRFCPSANDLNPILDDDKPKHDEKDFSPDYFLHTSWAARKLADSKPYTHCDFGSYTYFAGLCSAFVERFWFYDIRPLPVILPRLNCGVADMTALPFSDDSLSSLSTLHCIEHVGLGRYGDELDASGDRKAAGELSRVLAPGGQLIIVAPMNEKPHVTFNSDRYYSFEMFGALFPALKMREFAFVHENCIKVGRVPSGHYTGMAVFTK